MIRARQTCFCGELRAAVIVSSRTLSEAMTSILIPVRMPQCCTSHQRRESPTGLFRPDQSTRRDQNEYERITSEWSKQFNEVSEARSEGLRLRSQVSRYMYEAAQTCLCKALEGPAYSQGKLCDNGADPKPPQLPTKRGS